MKQYVPTEFAAAAEGRFVGATQNTCCAEPPCASEGRFVSVAQNTCRAKPPCAPEGQVRP